MPSALWYKTRVLLGLKETKCGVQIWLLGHFGLTDQVCKSKKLTVKLL